MKKVLLFASLSIAALSISSCSSDDEASTSGGYGATFAAQCKQVTTMGENIPQSVIDQLNAGCDCQGEAIDAAGITSAQEMANAEDNEVFQAEMEKCAAENGDF